MSKKIFCWHCSEPLGELADGTRIKKDIAHLCNSCLGTVKLWKEMASKYKPESDASNLFDNLGDLGDLFKGYGKQ